MRILLAGFAVVAIAAAQPSRPEPACCTMRVPEPLPLRIDEARKKMATDPNAAFLFHTLSAELALDTHRYAEAIPHYQEAARLQPENPQPVEDLGYVYLQFLHNTRPVLDLYRKALKLGGTVQFPVRHDHGWMRYCEGTIQLSRSQFVLASGTAWPKGVALHGFSYRLDEVKPSRSPSGKGGIRLAAPGYTMDLAAPQDAEAVRDMLLTLYHEAATN